MSWKKRKPKVTRPRGVEQGQKVTLKIAGMRQVQARVEDVGNTHVILGLFREPDQPLAMMGTPDATLETAGRRGTVEVVVSVRQHNDEPDAVRVDFDEGAKTIQRRDFFRMDAVTDVVLSRKNGAQVKTHTLDLSGSGLMLPGPPDLRMGERVWVAIDVGEDTPIRVHGSVVRETDENHKGIRFDMVDEAVRDRLIHFLFERQRIAARVRNR
jgi:hypothetical protein